MAIVSNMGHICNAGHNKVCISSMKTDLLALPDNIPRQEVANKSNGVISN